MLKETRKKYTQWARVNLAQEEISILINSEAIIVRITVSAITKSLGDRFNQQITHLEFVKHWPLAILTSIYIGKETPQHDNQNNVLAYHRLRYCHTDTGISYDIVIRQLIGKPVWELYFVHPTKP